MTTIPIRVLPTAADRMSATETTAVMNSFPTIQQVGTKLGADKVYVHKNMSNDTPSLAIQFNNHNAHIRKFLLKTLNRFHSNNNLG